MAWEYLVGDIIFVFILLLIFWVARGVCLEMKEKKKREEHK